MTPAPLRVGELGCGGVGTVLVELVRGRADNVASGTGLADAVEGAIGVRPPLPLDLAALLTIPESDEIFPARPDNLMTFLTTGLAPA